MKKLILTSVIAIVSVLICVLSLSYVNTVAQYSENSLKNVQTPAKVATHLLTLLYHKAFVAKVYAFTKIAYAL